jgi:CDP-diacylglycerol---glycerol-3-phosphate 3-phosphatidyltransferase
MPGGQSGARVCSQARLPVLLTTAGLGLNIAAGALIGAGAVIDASWNWPHLAAGIALLLAGALDVLDTMVARLAENLTKFAAFADSVSDLYADLAIFAGILTYSAARGSVRLLIVSAAALTGVLTMRYAQARAESLLPGRYDAGYMQRPEWLMVIIVSCLLNRLPVGMVMIALFTNLAAFHRIWDTHQTAHNLAHPDEAGRGYGSATAPA